MAVICVFFYVLLNWMIIYRESTWRRYRATNEETASSGVETRTSIAKTLNIR